MIDIKEALATTKTFTVPIKNLKINSRDEIVVNKTTVKMAAAAFKDLMDIVGLTQKTIYHLNDVLNPKAGFSLIREVMKAMERQSGRSLSLVICEETREVKRIAPEGEIGKSIAPDVIEELLLYALDKNKRVQLANKFVSDGGTRVTFQLNYDDPIALAIPGEEIKLGKQITWDMLGITVVENMVERLICINGITGIVSVKDQILDSDTSPSDWYKVLHEELTNPSQEILRSYERNVFEARQTNLSVSEFNKIYSHVGLHWKDDLDRITRYMGDGKWMKDYEKRNIDFEKCSVGQLKNCPTPVNAWDAVNCLTDLASHRNYRSDVSDSIRKNTQKLAGRMLKGTWDENHQILSVPSYSVRGPQFDDYDFTVN